MFLSLWVTALPPSAKEAIKCHLNPGESQAGTGGHPRGLPAMAGRQLPWPHLPRPASTDTGSDPQCWVPMDIPPLENSRISLDNNGISLDKLCFQEGGRLRGECKKIS